ncbi:MAG: hypothetical protein JJE52_09560 [Acidimicrobiia bacterium]|nr:hypothetical protein [Acidimicrobiia bacterium]
MDRPPPDAAKLLATWMEWEKGDSTPGRVMADLKKGGMREVLEHLANPASVTTTPISSTPSSGR